VLQCVECVAVCCSVLQCVVVMSATSEAKMPVREVIVCCSVLQCVAVC